MATTTYAGIDFGKSASLANTRKALEKGKTLASHATMYGGRRALLAYVIRDRDGNFLSCLCAGCAAESVRTPQEWDYLDRDRLHIQVFEKGDIYQQPCERCDVMLGETSE